jgi:exodeoxyribonuclease-1
MAAEKPDKTGALMYDLRIDPDEFKDLTPAELADLWKARGSEAAYFPVKELRYNKCPAVAPLGVMDDTSYERIKLHKEIVENHYHKLQAAAGFGDRLLEALELVYPKRQPELVADPLKVDGQLYDKFINDEDKTKMSVVRAAKPEELSGLNLDFKDERLKLLLPLYKARNFPKYLDDNELSEWEKFCRSKLLDSGRTGDFFKRLEDIAKTPGLTEEQRFLLEELNLYAQSLPATLAS